jgi:hypothetical protein
MIRDEQEFAKKITGYLDDGAAGLRAGTLYKLQQARARALASLAEPATASVQTRMAHALVGGGGGGVVEGGGGGVVDGGGGGGVVLEGGGGGGGGVVPVAVTVVVTGIRQVVDTPGPACPNRFRPQVPWRQYSP